MNIAIPTFLDAHEEATREGLYMQITLDIAARSIYHALVQDNPIIFNAITYHVAMLIGSENVPYSEKKAFFIDLNRMILDDRYEDYWDKLSEVKASFEKLLQEQQHVLTV